MFESRAHHIGQPVEQRDGQRAPFHHELGIDGVLALRGGRVAQRSTPVSMNSPPLRYSARPVRPSISVTSMPAHCSGSISE